MVPLWILHGLQRLLLLRPDQATSSRLTRWAFRGCKALSFLLILTGAALSVLFPAVRLPKAEGLYNVGVLDFYVPVHDATSGTRYVPARLWYPTRETPALGIQPFPYLDPKTAADYCRHSMKFGAPPPLQSFGWILHTWRLTTLPVVEAAALAEDLSEMPLVVYSHGLGGALQVYSYQAMELASHGSVVLSLSHTDGSAPAVSQPGSEKPLEYDHDIKKLWDAGKKEEYVRLRRSKTNHRVQEFLAVTEFVRELVVDTDTNENNDGGESTTCKSDDMNNVRTADKLRSLLQKVRMDHTFFMGHSFGGSTALTASVRRPDWVKAVIAHEPATDWIPDDARRSLFALERLKGLNHTYDGGTGGYYEPTAKEDAMFANSIHDLDLLVMHSNEWIDGDVGMSLLLQEMYQQNRLGKNPTVSRHHVVFDSRHNEFSDTSMMTPLWLARAVGMTGPRNPIETAQEIAMHTRSFLQQVIRTP